MKKTKVVLEVSFNESENQILEDVVGMLARLVYLLRRIPQIKAEHYTIRKEN